MIICCCWFRTWQWVGWRWCVVWCCSRSTLQGFGTACRSCQVCAVGRCGAAEIWRCMSMLRWFETLPRTVAWCLLLLIAPEDSKWYLCLDRKLYLLTRLMSTGAVLINVNALRPIGTSMKWNVFLGKMSQDCIQNVTYLCVNEKKRPLPHPPPIFPKLGLKRRQLTLRSESLPALYCHHKAYQGGPRKADRKDVNPDLPRRAAAD